MIRFRPPVVALALILLRSWPAAQPLQDSSVFQGGIPDRSGLIFMALHPEMTVAYDGKTGALFKAWKGRAERSMETAPTNESFYRVKGPFYYRQNSSNPWTVRNKKGEVLVTPKFDKVIQVEGHSALRTFLHLPQGRKITVLEFPGFDDHYGDNALRRNFSFAGIPPGFTVNLILSGEGMAEIWGGGGAGQLEKSPQGQWRLVQSEDGESPLKVTWSEPKKTPGKAPF